MTQEVVTLRVCALSTQLNPLSTLKGCFKIQTIPSHRFLHYVLGTDICSLRRDEGPCQAPQARWYFDKEEGKCLQFQYGGCQGNMNNFKSEKECSEVCRPDGGEIPTRKPKGRTSVLTVTKMKIALRCSCQPLYM